jgi:O-antigen ligase
MAIKLLTILAALALMGFLFRVFLRSPRAGVLAVIATAPLEKLSLYAGLTWKPFILLTPPLVGALLWRWWKGRDARPRFDALEGAMASVLGISLLSGLTAEAPGLTWRMAFQIALLIANVWSLLQCLRSREDVEKAIHILKISGVAVLLYGLFQFIGWPLGIDTHWLMKIMPRNPTIPYMFTIPGAVVMAGRSVVRLSSTFFDWNIFAAFVVLILSLSLSQLAWRMGRRMPLRREALLAALGVFILFFTFSRSSWIGMAVALAVLALAWRRFFRRGKVRLALGLTAVVLLLGIWSGWGPFGFVRTRMEMMFEGDASIYKHTIYAQAALEMFRRSPALGVGLHNFSAYYTGHFDPNDFGTTAHSAYLTFFAETGLLGGVANLALILLVLQSMTRSLRRYSPEHPEYAWIAGLGAAYVGMLASSFFYLFYNQVYLWVTVGLIGAIERLPESSPEPGREERS